ncbi:hypothetical protein AK51_25325 [Serratia nematodiphila DZ0503SBS1]|nr:hypothetical protein AK51_25325 [Serratia nematodiphila DZ0503SBS1]
MRQLRAFDACYREDARLLHFAQERRLFAQGRRHGYAQYHFIHFVSQLAGRGIQIKFNFRLPFLLENLRRVRRFEGDILGIDTLDLESHFGAVLF